MRSRGAVWVVLADIHANLDALQAVIADAAQEAQRLGVPPKDLGYISLGDVVDYGPDPVPCLDWVEKHCTIKIRGNHDLEAAKCPRDRIELVKKELWPVSVWTRCQLNSDQRRQIQSWAWPHVARLGAHTFAVGHATLDPDDKRQDANLGHQALFEQLAATGARYGLVGHTHTPMIWLSDWQNPILPEDAALPRPTDLGWFDLAALQRQWGGQNRSIIFNPGGLGQPRCIPTQQLGPCAPYLLLDTRDSNVYYKFRQVDYPYQKTAAKIAGIRLPNPLPIGCDSDDQGMLESNEIAYLYRQMEMELEELGDALRTPPLRTGI